MCVYSAMKMDSHMKNKVLILGGYGVFGQRIAIALSKEANIKVIVAGRHLTKAEEFAKTIHANAVQVDITTSLDEVLDHEQPQIVINCCGPFQGQNYVVAKSCIKRGIDYIDLADAREYVGRFAALHDEAVDNNMIAISGASTVPAISSAILDYFLEADFSEIHSIDYGITPGNQTPRGIATVAAILSYIGKPFGTRMNGKTGSVFGWQNLHREKYPQLGMRWMANCDIPDLELFSSHYPSLRNIRFYAGLELSLLHIGLWLLSWLVRIGWVKSLMPYAKKLKDVSLWFYSYGTKSGGMHMKIEGNDKHGQPTSRAWYILANDGDGLQIPSTPAVILTKKILAQKVYKKGAYPAMSLITREEILSELKAYSVKEIIH